MSLGRYQYRQVDGPALPHTVIDSWFGGDIVARFRSRCLADEFCRTLNEPFFRLPSSQFRPENAKAAL